MRATKLSRFFPAVLCLLVAGLTGASLAFACTPDGWGYGPPPSADSSPPPSPPPGDSAPTASQPPAPAATPQPAAAPAPAPSATPQGSSSPQRASAPARGKAPAPATTPARGGTRAQARQAPRGASTVGRSTDTGTPTLQSRRASAANPGLEGGAFPGSSAAKAESAGTRGRSSGRRGASERSASADLTGAFAPGSGAGLSSVTSATAPASGPAGQLKLALGLLALGSLGLVGVSAAAALGRRRRAVARSES